MTNVADITLSTTDHINPDYRQLKISIGGDGKNWIGFHPCFDVTGIHGAGPYVYLLLPKSVAEHFRQEGRRQLQSELRQLINAERA